MRLNNPKFKVRWNQITFGFGWFTLFGYRQFEVYLGPVIFSVCF